jgi:hypothetical protein
MDAIRDRYGVTIETYFPQADAVERMVRAKGSISSTTASRTARVAASGSRTPGPRAGWRESVGHRAAQRPGGHQNRHPDDRVRPGARQDRQDQPLDQLVEEQVWEYIKANQVPYNRLHDQGFPASAAPRARARSSPAKTFAPAGGGGNRPSTRNAACMAARAHPPGKRSEEHAMAQTDVVTHPVPLEIQEEIDHYEEEARRFLRGEVHAEVFRRFRLQHGIYGQRQDGVQMVRIKIPFGG